MKLVLAFLICLLIIFIIAAIIVGCSIIKFTNGTATPQRLPPPPPTISMPVYDSHPLHKYSTNGEKGDVGVSLGDMYLSDEYNSISDEDGSISAGWMVHHDSLVDWEGGKKIKSDDYYSPDGPKTSNPKHLYSLTTPDHDPLV